MFQAAHAMCGLFYFSEPLRFKNGAISFQCFMTVVVLER